MKSFLNRITLSKNARGCYILDTVKGCRHNCYGDCYAKNIANRYKLDFDNPVRREFNTDNQLLLFGFCNTSHQKEIIKAIEKIDMPFVRIGEMGDPSEFWEHTIGICKIIAQAGKKIVIITKHWKAIPDALLDDIRGLNVCFNTSISALDSDQEIDYRLAQYQRLKSYCDSVLRIVSCNFNTENIEGDRRAKIQEGLFKNQGAIDTVFRPSPNNPLVVNGIINVEKVEFLRSKVLASVYNKSTYFGTCDKCPQMCGINNVAIPV